jgi:hypothetical protein
MARSYGSAATLLALKEASYGVKPPGNWEKFAFVSSDIGAEQNLLSSELLGQGREPRAPFRDVINDEGNFVVPVEARDFGRWLQLLMGNPTSAGVAATGDITFTANPSASHTITINGVVWTFVAIGRDGYTDQYRCKPECYAYAAGNRSQCFGECEHHARNLFQRCWHET